MGRGSIVLAGALLVGSPAGGCTASAPPTCDEVTEHIIEVVTEKPWEPPGKPSAAFEIYGYAECERGRKVGRYSDSAMRCAMAATTSEGLRRCDIWYPPRD